MYKKYFLEDLRKVFDKLDFNWINDSKLQILLKKLDGDFRFVGGCIRDSLLGISTKDIDVCTTLHPDKIESNLVNSYNISVVGKRFGTIGVFLKNYQVEITTTREDIATYGREADVNFTTSFARDTERRDFTFNALLCYIDDDQRIVIEDYHNGIEDLINRKVRFIGNASLRIQEDYLRILRFIRFSARYCTEIDINTLDIIKTHISNMSILSSERVIDEIIMMCKKGNTLMAINCINELNIPNLENKLYIDQYWKLTDLNMKIASLFFYFKNWKKLNLPKDIKYILKFKEISQGNYYDCVSTSWYRNKDSNVILYINMWRDCYQLPIYTCPDLELYNYSFSKYTGIIRGEIEILARKLYLQNNDMIYEHINQIYQDRI